MIWAVVLALVGAFCLALGSALQERDAIRAPGGSVARISFLWHLVRRPRWLLGALAAAVGVGLHLAALSAAPLTIIQPIGVSGLLFAIVLSALFSRQRVRASQLLAGVAVMVGLVGIITLFPHGADSPMLPLSAAVTLASGVVAAGGVGYLVAPWLPAGARAILLAAFGGAALGTPSPTSPRSSAGSPCWPGPSRSSVDSCSRTPTGPGTLPQPTPRSSSSTRSSARESACWCLASTCPPVRWNRRSPQARHC